MRVNPETAPDETADSGPAKPRVKPPPVADVRLVDAWLTYLGVYRGRQPRTIDSYRHALNRLMEFLDGKPLATAEPAELEAFSGLWLHRRGVIARSRLPYISAVKGFYAWATKAGHLKRNPAAMLVRPQVGRPLPRSLSLASAEKLMWAPNLNTFQGIRDAAMLALLVGCGIRVSGLVGLNDGSLRNEAVDGKVRLMIRVTEKGNKERLLPVPREAEMLLRIYLDHEELKQCDRDIVDDQGRPDKVLFVNRRNYTVQEHERRGERLRFTRWSVWDMIRRYGKARGIPDDELHPHAFRHLYGTELAEENVDLITRQHLMGHADPKSTEIYTELSLRRKMRVVDQAGPLAKLKTPVSEVLKRIG